LAEALAQDVSATGMQADRSRLAQAARCAAIIHDLGKYAPEFQRRLFGEPVRVVHPLQGAKLAAGEKAVDVAMSAGMSAARGDEAFRRMVAARAGACGSRWFAKRSSINSIPSRFVNRANHTACLPDAYEMFALIEPCMANEPFWVDMRTVSYETERKRSRAGISPSAGTSRSPNNVKTKHCCVPSSRMLNYRCESDH
jgi:hypothetical protein